MKFFLKKTLVFFFQKYDGNLVRDEVEAQFAYSNQMSESVNPSKSKPVLPKEFPTWLQIARVASSK